ADAPEPQAPPVAGDLAARALQAIAEAKSRVQAASLAVEAEHARRAAAAAVEEGVRSREATRDRTEAQTHTAWEKARAARRAQAARTRELGPSLEVSGPAAAGRGKSCQARQRLDRGHGHDGQGFGR